MKCGYLLRTKNCGGPYSGPECSLKGTDCQKLLEVLKLPHAGSLALSAVFATFFEKLARNGIGLHMYASNSWQILSFASSVWRWGFVSGAPAYLTTRVGLRFPVRLKVLLDPLT